MMLATSQEETYNYEEKCLSSTESSDLSDSSSVRGYSARKNVCFVCNDKVPCVELPTCADLDSEPFPSSSPKPTSINCDDGVNRDVFGDTGLEHSQFGSFTTLQETDSSQTDSCEETFEDFRTIIRKHRRNQRYFLLTEYPEIALIKG